MRVIAGLRFVQFPSLKAWIFNELERAIRERLSEAENDDPRFSIQLDGAVRFRLEFSEKVVALAKRYDVYWSLHDLLKADIGGYVY